MFLSQLEEDFCFFFLPEVLFSGSVLTYKPKSVKLPCELIYAEREKLFGH